MSGIRGAFRKAVETVEAARADVQPDAAAIAARARAKAATRQAATTTTPKGTK